MDEQAQNGKASDTESGHVSEAFDLRLAREIRQLDKEIQPSRDLWQGIERNISDTPQTLPFTNRFKQRVNTAMLMPMGVAASLLVAVSALILNMTQTQYAGDFMAASPVNAVDQAYLPVRNPMVEAFNETNKHLPEEALEDLYKNYEILAAARRQIESEIQESPEDERLLAMLISLQEQEIELLKQDYSARGRSL